MRALAAGQLYPQPEPQRHPDRGGLLRGDYSDRGAAADPAIASRDGQSAGFFTGLFTATSSTCVTGLILVDTWTQWTLFGQAVILTMIQLGGLGFMTVITLVSFALHRRIGLSERLIMVSTLNLNDMDGVVRVVRHALIGTFAMETAGAVLMSVCLIRSSASSRALGTPCSTQSPPSATRALICWEGASVPSAA